MGFLNFLVLVTFSIFQTDPTNTYSTDGSNVNISVTGTANDALDQGTAALATTLDLDWIVNGSNNTIDSDIDVDLATNYYER